MNKVSILKEGGRKQLFTLSILLLVIFCINQAVAQKKLSILKLPMEGLSNPTVTSIYQDKTGFLWFGTPDGLNRFDGYSYKVYRHSDEDTSTISSNYINAIAEDANGRLWVGTKNGLNVLDRVSDRFTKYLKEPENRNSLPNNNVECFLLDSQKRFWIGSWGGLSLYEPNGATFTNFSNIPENDNSLSGNIVVNLTEDKNGSIWIATHFSGLNAFDPNTGKITRFTHDPNNNSSISSNNISRVYEDGEGKLWVGTFDKGLNKYNPEKDNFTRYNSDGSLNSLGTNAIYSIFENINRQLIVGGMNGGMSIYNPERNNFMQFDSYGNYKTGGIKASVFCHFKTETGEVLISTSEGGVSIYDNYSNGFNLYKNNPDNDNSLSFNSVKAIAEDRSGNLWIGTDGGGLNYFNTQTKNFTRFTMDKENSIDNTIEAVLADSEGDVWIGTRLNGLFKFEPLSNTFTPLKQMVLHPKSYPSHVHRLFQDHRGTIWIGNESFLYAFDKKKKNIESYRKDVTQKYPLGTIETLQEVSNGSLLAGSSEGLFLFNRQINGFERLAVNFQNKNIPYPSPVTTLFGDSKKRVWVSLHSYGLGILDLANNAFIPVLENSGFFKTNVTNIIEDEQHYLWITSGKGLFKCKTLTRAPYIEVLNYYNDLDGLQSNLFNTTAVKRKTGELVLGGINGFNIFDPRELKSNPGIHEVVITSIKIAGRNAYQVKKDIPMDLSLLKTVSLSEDEADLNIEFASLNYIKSNKNQYAYKLEGLEQDWVFAGTARTASYNDLPPGDYVFKVIGSNNDGIWNRKGTTISIKVLPLFTNTIWFYLLCMLFVLALIGVVYWYFSESQPDRVETYRQKVKRLIQNSVVTLPPVEEKVNEDQLFITKLLELIELRIGDSEFGVDEICKEMGISRPQLYRKVKIASEKPVSEIIRHIRLERSKILLQSKDHLISDVAVMVGFKSLSHFSKSFQAEYGMSPSQFILKMSQLAEN